MAEKEVQVYSFTLNIQSIKMKVKFPCKMKLEYASEILTTQVSQNQSGKFIFNQQVTLKEDTDKTYFQIIAHITTDKGAKYIAGVMKLSPTQLVQQEGQMMVISLTKCLDSEACCQLRVDQVSSEKVVKKVPIQKVMASKNRQFQQDFSPKKYLSPNFEVPKNFTGSKSQFNFPITNNRIAPSFKNKQQGYLSIYQRQRSPINMKKTNVAATYIQRNLPQFNMIDSSNRDKLIQAEVYKESYQKLKQKYKKQAETAKQQLNKRIALQNNENNYKLQIMRIKLRCQQQQKTINDKNIKLKQLQLLLASLQKKQLDLSYLKEETMNKDHNIRMLQDTIRALNKDNDDLKNLNRQRFQAQQDKIKQLRAELDLLKQKYQAKVNQLQRQIKAKVQIISQKDTDIRVKQQRIQRQQRLIDQLEKINQTKAFQFQRALQNQQNDFKLKSDQFKNTIQRLQKQKAKIQQQLESVREEQQKIKSIVVKMQYDRKIGSQEVEGFKAQLGEAKILRQKYQELQRDHKILTQDKNHLQKQFQKTLQSRDSSLTDLNKQFKEQVDYYRKIYKQVEEKMRNSQNKNLELQSSLQQKKNQYEKMKKNNDALTKQNNDLKQRQKVVRKGLKTKQQQLTIISAQLESNKYKTKSGDQLSRYEMENLREELNKTKRDFDIQTLKSAQLLEKVSNLNSQCNKLKLQVQQAQDQNQKDTITFKQKNSSLQNQNRDYEKRVDDLNSLVANLRNSDKQNQMKLQKSQLQGLKTNQKIEKLQKQIRILQDKVQQVENQIKNKQGQIGNLQNVRQNLQKKLQQNQQKLNSVKNNLNTMTGQKNKNDKIIQLLNRQINDFKQQIERQTKIIQSKQKTQQDLRNQIKKSKQQYLKLQMKNTALKKQYDRFKQHLSQTLSSTFSQIPLGATDLRGSSILLQPVAKRSQNLDSNTVNVQILNKVNSQYKDIKVAMSKVNEHNKMLQKEVERLNEEGMTTNSKNQYLQSSLNKRIQQLEDQILRISSEKQQKNAKNRNAINQLQTELEERQNTNKQLLLQIQQFNFTINSLKMDQQASSQHFNIKHNQYKSKISELEEKISYLSSTINQSQSSNHSLQTQLGQKVSELETEKQINEKKQKQIGALKQQKKILTNLSQENKKQRKELLQKISQLQLKLGTQVQLKDKNKSLLQDEQRKGGQLKDFVANLMKQKQLAIKGDLEKSEQIIKLQAFLLQTTRQKQMQADQIERVKKILDDQKEIVKKLIIQVKDLQALGTDQKAKFTKLYEKFKQKERQLKQNQDALSKLKSEYQKLNSKSTKTINDLSNQLQQKTKQKDKQIKNLNQQLTQVQKQKQQLDTKILTLKGQILVLQENLFMQKQSCQVKTEEANRNNEEIEKLQAQLKHLQDTINLLNEEIKEKQEGMFQLSGKVYHLEANIEAKQAEYNQRYSNLSEDWSSKYENVVEEYQQRIQLVQKQKTYFKGRLQQKEQQHRKLVAVLRSNQLQESNLKKGLQQKIKRLEQERLAIISSKNVEIQRLAQDNKSKFETLKVKQADQRRLQHEIQVARSTIIKLDQSKKETQQKIKQINRVYQSQLEQLKRRESMNRNNAQQLERIQWDVERQVKRAIQAFTKKLSTGPQQENQKALLALKGLEDQVVNAISNKLSSSII